MTFVCSSCGERHAELPQCFSFERPEDCIWFLPWNRRKFVLVNEYMCHYADKRHYIKCLLGLPVRDTDVILEFLVWIGVSGNNFHNYASFRANEDEEPLPPEFLPGYLCNAVPEHVADLGRPIWFTVHKGDPLPMVSVRDERLALYASIAKGVSPEFWHRTAKLFER